MRLIIWFADASFHLMVLEGQTTPITDAVVLFTDDSSNDRDIVYTITSITAPSDDLVGCLI